MSQSKEESEATKRLQEKLAIQKTQEMSEQARALREEARMKEWQASWANYMQKLKKDGVVKDEHGREMTHWDRVVHEAFKAIHSEQHAYNDWRSAMMSLLSMLTILVGAIDHSLKETLAENKKITQLRALASTKIGNVKDVLVDKIRGNPRVDLPTLIHSVSMKEDNKLDIAPLKRSDEGTTFLERKDQDGKVVGRDPLFDQEFKLLVTLWLYKNGYEPGAVENTYVSKTDQTPLTQERFNALKNDPDNGLDVFLHRTSDLTFESARPTP